MLNLPETIDGLARTFGLPTVNVPNWALRGQITALLRVLTNDIRRGDEINDGHPRFHEHSAVIALFSLKDEATERRILAITFGANADQIALEGIAWIRSQWGI